jgi:hypothetical protein
MAKDFELVEENAIESPVKDIKWYGKEDQTEEKPMHDVGVGDAITIRLFEFKFSPDLEKLPTAEEILTPGYIKSLHAQLWGDALRMVMEPRVHIDKEGCKIFVPCQAATGHTFLEQPKLLQEWIK